MKTSIRRFLLALTLFLVPVSGIAQSNALELLHRGDAKAQRGDLDGAIADYSQAIELDPKNVSAYNNRAYAKEQKGDREGAMTDYKRARDLARF